MRFETLVVAVFAFSYPSAGFVRADDAPTWEKQVAPFLKTYCVGCHDGGDDSKGGLSLLTHKALMAGGDGGEAIVPGKSADSRLVQMLLGKEEPRMPPKDAKQPKAEEIALITRWVDLGARGPSVDVPQSADELKLPHIRPRSSTTPAVTSLKYSADGRWVAASRHREVIVLGAATGRLAYRLAGAENPINAVAFSPDGQVVAAAEGLPGVVGKIRLWALPEGPSPEPVAPTRTLTGHTDSVYAVAFSPDGAQLVTGSYDKLLILWDVVSGAEKHTLKHHTGAVFGAAFSPDGKTLASVAADQTVKLWNVATGQRILTLIEPTKGLNAVAFHPTGHELAAVGVDKMIRIYEWNGSVAKLKKSAFAHDAAILAVDYSPDGKTLYTGGEDRRLKAWDAEKLQERHVYELLADWPLALAVNPAGDQLAVGLYSGGLMIFDPRSTEKRNGVTLPVAAAFRSTGRRPVRDFANTARVVDRRSHGAMTHATGGGLYELLAAAAIGQAEAKPEAAKPEPKPNPPTPRFDAISPRTVVRGQKVKFTLHGQNVSAADRLFISAGTLKPTLLPPDEKNANAAFCEIEIPADMPPGMVSIRLHTPLGTAGQKSFYVGPFAELGEKEDNGARDKATPAALPATLVGTINSRGDRDVWSFAAAAGQELAFVLVGPNMGSSLQARMSLTDEQGGVINTVTRHPARGETVLTHRFSSPGKFFLQVEDRDYMGGGNHYYYIHAGAIPYVTGVWPLAMRGADQGTHSPNEVAAIDVTGVNLLPETKLRPTPGAGAHFVAPFATAGKTINSARYESSSYPEFVEVESNDLPQQAQNLPVPAGVTGRFRLEKQNGDPMAVADSSADGPKTGAPRGDRDHFAFTARKGDRLTIETLARRLGSPVDTVIDILDPEGRPVPRATLRAVAETYTVLRDHDSRSKGIRLQNWEDVLPNDLMLIGDEILKVQILPLGPDEDVKFFDRFGPRMGYLGTTPQAHAINSAAFKVEVHPPGSAFAATGMPVVPLYWSNDDAPGLGSDSQVLFDVPADGTYVVRVRDVRDLTGDACVYRLVVRPRNEDFRITLDSENPNIPRGGSLPVTVNVDRLDGFNGPVDVRVEGLPAGLSATSTRIGPDTFSAMFTITHSEAAVAPATDAAQPPAPDMLGMRVIASAMIDGKPVERTTTPGFGSHHLTITSPPDLAVTVEPSAAEISPGQELRFTATIERRNGFQGRVPVDVLNLPHGLRVLDVGLNGVLINENETSRSFVVACDPWAPTGPLTFYAAARVESKNERHAAPGIRLNVKTDPAPGVASTP